MAKPSTPLESNNPLTTAPILSRKRSHEEMNSTRPKSEQQGPDKGRGATSASPTRPSSVETERPPSGQRQNPEHDANEVPSQTPGDDEVVDEEADPTDDLEDFDWGDLEARYHVAMNNCCENDAQLLQEWSDLMNFFNIWAEAGHAHETERSFKRLKTRMAHVRHSEDDFERKRAHYMNVVKAFESALQLLNSPSG